MCPSKSCPSSHKLAPLPSVQSHRSLLLRPPACKFSIFSSSIQAVSTHPTADRVRLQHTPPSLYQTQIDASRLCSVLERNPTRTRPLLAGCSWAALIEIAAIALWNICSYNFYKLRRGGRGGLGHGILLVASLLVSLLLRERLELRLLTGAEDRHFFAYKNERVCTWAV